ncbi:DUF6541 family protein [Actinomyces vulturis]|uniref:DUF6541 family protein n=1 Tax=Actinomyces vulturis TaxID=1857645 RepID=UPI00083620F1|nr:DUF6541 family protein [Actinomyces vulturis]
MIHWLWLSPVLFFFVFLTFLPGLLLISATGLHGALRRLALAPAVTFAFVGAGGVILHYGGIWWHLVTVVPLGLTVIAIAIVARVVVEGRHGDRWDFSFLTDHHFSLDGARRFLRRCWRAAPWLSRVIMVWFIMILPILVVVDPLTPSQSGDALYHYNQVWLIEHTGNASMLDGNAGLFGMDGTSSFYPMVWHDLVSLGALGWTQSLPVTNVMLLVVPLIWICGILYLTRTVLPDVAHADVFALGLIALPAIFPMRLLFDTALWPYCLMLSACPAVVAFILDSWRQFIAHVRNHHYAQATLWALAPVVPLLGVIFTHPSALVVIGWPLVLIAWSGLVLAGIRQRRSSDSFQRRRGTWILVIAGFLVFATIVFVLGPGPQQAHFGRRPHRNWHHLWDKLFQPFFLYYAGGGHMMWISSAIILLLLTLGVWAVLTQQKHRGVLIGWASILPLIVAATAPIPVLSALTGLFYNNPHRIKAMAVPALILLMAIGLSYVWQRSPFMQRWSPNTVAAILLIVATIASTPGLISDARGGFSPQPGDTRFMVDSDELAMIKRLRHELPDDALVIGDPVAGAGMIPFITGRESVWTFPGQASSDQDGLYLRNNFRRLHSDPRVCAIIRRHNIRYFYADQDRNFNGVHLSELRPGLYNVPTYHGFTLIDHGGTAALYRIDSCYDQDNGE